jgi:hypothetical protein
MKPLGREVPKDFDHVAKYPLQAAVPIDVERVLLLPRWHWTHDQGHEGSCVGHGSVMERAITNTAQNRLLRVLSPSRRYDPIWLWNEAKRIDEWSETVSGDDNGTSVRAAYDVLRGSGACRVRSVHLVNGVPTAIGARPADPGEGILTNRWARTVDEMRAALADGLPVTIGVNWYPNFDAPIERGGEHWIGDVSDLGAVRGGHCVCVYGASDRRQAFKIKNSWGRSYPLVWLPYTTMDRLLREDGEACLVTDR